MARIGIGARASVMNLLTDTARTSLLLLLLNIDPNTISLFNFKQSSPLIVIIQLQDDEMSHRFKLDI